MIDDMTDQAAAGAAAGGSRWRPWWYALGVLIVGLAMLGLALWVGGGRPQPAPPGLPDPGPFVGWTLPAARFVVDVAAVVAAGAALVAAALLPPEDEKTGALAAAGRRSMRTTGIAAGIGLVTAAAELVLTYADFLGITAVDAVARPGISSFVVDTVQGRALLAQVVLFGVLALGVASVRTVFGAGWIAMVSFGAAVAPAFAGHSSSAAYHVIAQSSLLVHVVAATAWVGGLAGVSLVARRRDVPLGRVAKRYSALAGWCFVAVAVSGVVNAWVRIGTLEEAASSYGLVVSGKLAALVVLGVLGALHRSRTLPALDTSRRPFVRLAAVEVACMSATVGIAVGLSRTPTPVPQERSAETLTTAEAVLGFPMPPVISPVRIFTEAFPDGYWLTFAVLAAALYLKGVRVLRRRGDSWPVARTVAWFGGLATILVLTCSGLGRYAMVMFSVHMAQHMSFNMLIPILLVLGAPVTLALRALPARGHGSGLRRILLDLLKSKVVRVLTHPLVAGGIFVVSLYVLYFSGLFGILMRDHWGHLLMQGHFMLSGGLFFWVLIGLDPGPRRIPYPLRMVLLLAVMASHAFFSIALMSFGRVIGARYFALLDRPWLSDLVDDQRLGGAIGWAFGEIPVLIVLGALFVQWVGADRRRAAAIDRALDREEAEQNRT